MREKNGMLEPPYCFFYSSVQALTLHFGSFLLCFAMPGILCLGEITVTCQCSIKRGKEFLLWHLAAALCFRLGRAIWEMEKNHTQKKNRGPERGSEQRESAKSVSSVSSLPGTPQSNTSSCAFPFVLHILLPAAICPPSHRQPQSYSRGKAWLHSYCLERVVQAVFPPRCLTVCLPRRSTLKAEAPHYK